MKGHSNPTIRTTDDGERVGPKMHEAVLAASNHGAFASKNRLAVRVGPNSSQDYGYRIVDRCIKTGLICRPDSDHDEANPHGNGAVYLTDKGQQYLENEGSDE